MVGGSRISKFVKSNLLREYNVDLLGRFYDFSQQTSRFVRSTAKCSATVHRDLLVQNGLSWLLIIPSVLQYAGDYSVFIPV